MTQTDGGMTFTPPGIEFARGALVQFALRNEGELDHGLVIGTIEENPRRRDGRAPRHGAVDPNAKRLKPGAWGVLTWQITKLGTFEYACLVPGRREASMVGTAVVNETLTPLLEGSRRITMSQSSRKSFATERTLG